MTEQSKMPKGVGSIDPNVIKALQEQFPQQVPKNMPQSKPKPLPKTVESSCISPKR